MWKVIFLLALVKTSLGGIFDFSEYDDPYGNNFFFNRPAVIIRQQQGRCRTNLDGTDQEGTCLTRPECSFGGGRPQGRQSCLFGVCCVYARSCNQITSRRVSYFEGTTRSDNNVCSFTVRTENDNICQMRLDFDSLNLPSATRDQIVQSDGTIIQTGPYTCRDAYFQVESPNNFNRIPILCGNNNGQHIYVPINATRGERDLVIKVVNDVVANDNGNSVSWKIKITQLECPGNLKHSKNAQRAWEDRPLIAPEGCLQYYLAPTGTIRNIGYDTGRPLASNHYESNFNYAICFRRTADMCGMDLSVRKFPGKLSGTFLHTTTSNSNANLPSNENPLPCLPDNNIDCEDLLFGINNFNVSGTFLNPTDPNQATLPCTRMIDTNIYRDADFLYVPNGFYTTVQDNGGTLTTVTGLQDRYCGSIPTNTRIRSVTPGPFYIFFRTDNEVIQDANNPAIDDENGWEITYSTLYGGSCGPYDITTPM